MHRLLDLSSHTALTLTYFNVMQLISLSDLENDFVNPHDASAALNKWTVSQLAECLHLLTVPLTAYFLVSSLDVMV